MTGLKKRGSFIPRAITASTLIIAFNIIGSSFNIMLRLTWRRDIVMLCYLRIDGLTGLYWIFKPCKDTIYYIRQSYYIINQQREHQRAACACVCARVCASIWHIRETHLSVYFTQLHNLHESSIRGSETITGWAHFETPPNNFNTNCTSFMFLLFFCSSMKAFAN